MRAPRLTVRITLSFAAGALVASGVLATATYFLTERFLVAQQEHNVLHQTYFNALAIHDGLLSSAPDIPGLLDTLPTGGDTNAVVEHRGRWYSSSLSVSRDALPGALRTRVLRGEVIRGWGDVGHQPVLIVGVPLPGVAGAYFQVADESGLARTLATLRDVLLGTAAGVTILGAGAGVWASRRLTAPIRAVAGAAQRISGGDLTTRLPAESDAELAGLVDSFNAMVDSLYERIQRDARFAADVSHELRSPLTTLSTSLSVLKGRRDELSSRGRDALDLLAEEVTRFQRLVEDLLEISRADAMNDGVARVPVRIGEFVSQLLSDPRYSNVSADLDPQVRDAVVVGDKRRLELVLRNLLDNAESYAGGATCVTVQPSSTGVAILVDDDGPGVPPADRNRIFERFTRGESNRRRASSGGTGLGLALVREHVRAFGGEVSVQDGPGGGARFVVELPLERAA